MPTQIVCFLFLKSWQLSKLTKLIAQFAVSRDAYTTLHLFIRQDLFSKFLTLLTNTSFVCLSLTPCQWMRIIGTLNFTASVYCYFFSVCIFFGLTFLWKTFQADNGNKNLMIKNILLFIQTKWILTVRIFFKFLR